MSLRGTEWTICWKYLLLPISVFFTSKNWYRKILVYPMRKVSQSVLQLASALSFTLETLSRSIRMYVEKFELCTTYLFRFVFQSLLSCTFFLFGNVRPSSRFRLFFIMRIYKIFSNIHRNKWSSVFQTCVCDYIAWVNCDKKGEKLISSNIFSTLKIYYDQNRALSHTHPYA